MKLTPEDALVVREHGTPSVNNRRHYLRYGGVFYPLASVVWTIEMGEWPKSTPRHLDGNPANNDLSNLRPPGRTKKPRKTRISVIEENQPVTPALKTYEDIEALARSQKPQNPASLFA